MKKVHWYYKFLILFIIFFSMFFLLTENMSSIINSSSYKNYINFISVPFDFLNKYNIFNYRNVLLENERLVKNSIIITNERSELKTLREEVDSLSKLLDIKNTYSDYDSVFAKVITRNKMYWFNTIRINVGSSSGVKEGDIVVSSEGLVGEVFGVTKDFSTVRLITSNSFDGVSIGVKVGNTFKYGTIVDYEDSYLKIEMSTDADLIEKGDEVVTSGLGDIPKNVKIGKVFDVKKDSYGVSTILFVKPYQDMNYINYVMVLI